MVTQEKRGAVKDKCRHTHLGSTGRNDYRGLEQPEKNFNLVAR